MSSDVRVICISGKAGSGKDTAGQAMASILREVGCRVLVVHYGGLVKYICRTFFGWDGKKDEKGRTLLQKVGTDVVRAHNPNYWVGFLISVVRMFPDEWNVIIIPDCRFPNEVTYWERFDIPVDLVRIERVTEVRRSKRKGLVRRLRERSREIHDMTDEQRAHVSETAMDDFPAAYTIVNDGSLKQFRKEAAKTALSICGFPEDF